MEYLGVVAALAVIEYMVFTLAVGRARGRLQVPAPATSGNPEFERYFRVQQNSVEQLVVFLPALWLFGAYVSAPIGALVGLVFVVGRLLYALGYWRAAERRGLGFGIGFLANAVLVVGGLIGAVIAAL